MWEYITSLPATFWFSIAALIVAILSLLFTIRNFLINNDNSKLLTLEKKTSLLFELIDVISKVSEMERLLNKIEKENSALKSSEEFNQLKQSGFALSNPGLAEAKLTMFRNNLIKFKEGLQDFKKECESLTEESDPRKIEALIPWLRENSNNLDDNLKGMEESYSTVAETYILLKEKRQLLKNSKNQ